MKNSTLISNTRPLKRPQLIHKLQGGYLMIELALTLAVGTILAASQVTQINQAVDSALSVSTGQYMTALQTGVGQYIFNNMPALSIGSPVTGFPTPLQPTIAQLVANGYLQTGFSNVSPLGLSFNNTLSLQNCPGSNCSINGFSYSTTPYKDGSGAIRSDVLADALRTAGVDGGMSYAASPGLLNGFGGGWGTVASPVANPAGNVAGTIAIRLGSNSGIAGQLSQFYKLDGSRQLTGAMDANGNNINNAAQVNAGQVNASTITATGDVNGDQYITAIKTVGAPCSTNGALASGSGVVMVCTGGTWQVQTGERSNVGTACSPNGKTATSIATQETIVCRSGVYVGLANLLARTVEVSRQMVIDGNTVAKAACPGGLPNARMIPLTWAVDVTAAPPIEGVYMYPVDNGATWYAQISVFPPAPGAWQSGNVVGAKAMLINECTYN